MESSNELEPWRSLWSKMLRVTIGRLRMYHHLMTVDNHHMMGFDIKTHWIQWSVWLEWTWTTYLKYSEVAGHFEKFTWQGGPSHFVLTFQDHDTSHTTSEANVGRMIFHIPMRIIHNSPIIFVSTAKAWWFGRLQKNPCSQNRSSPKLRQMENQFCPLRDPHMTAPFLSTFGSRPVPGSGPVSEWSVEFDLQRLVGSLQGEVVQAVWLHQSREFSQWHLVQAQRTAEAQRFQQVQKTVMMGK